MWLSTLIIKNTLRNCLNVKSVGNDSWAESTGTEVVRTKDKKKPNEMPARYLITPSDSNLRLILISADPDSRWLLLWLALGSGYFNSNGYSGRLQFRTTLSPGGTRGYKCAGAGIRLTLTGVGSASCVRSREHITSADGQLSVTDR